MQSAHATSLPTVTCPIWGELVFPTEKINPEKDNQVIAVPFFNYEGRVYHKGAQVHLRRRNGNGEFRIVRVSGEAKDFNPRTG